MSHMTLSSRDVESLILALNDIAPDHEGPAKGRLKHITRQDFPPGVGLGRGMPALYDADAFFQMVTMIELTQLGVSMHRAIRLVNEAWPRLRVTVLQVWLSFDATHRLNVATPIEQAFWCVPAEAWRDLARPDRGYSPDSEDIMTVMTLEEVNALMATSRFNIRRRAFIVAHQLVEDVLDKLWWGHLGMVPDKLAVFMAPLIPPPTVEV